MKLQRKEREMTVYAITSRSASDCKGCAMWPCCLDAGVFREGRVCRRFVPMDAPDMGMAHRRAAARLYRRSVAKGALMAVAGCGAFLLLAMVPA